MKKIISKIEEMELTTREYFLFGAALLLLGFVLGLIFSPKGDRSYGSNNGNNNTGCACVNDNEKDETEDEE